jgi:alpha-mannosidase
MTAWVIGQFLTREDLVDGGHLTQVHGGPYVQRYRWTRGIGGSSVEVEISLRAGSPRLEYRLTVDWREMGSREHGIPHLRVRFPLALEHPEPRYGIPYGGIHRSLCNGEEVPAQRWADLSEAGGAGVTLVNSSKYGHSLDGSSLEMTLLRASIDPDPLPDLGEHVIEYALRPHGAQWGVGDAARAGQTLNVPLSVASCAFHSGELPGALSFVRIEQTNVHLAALKQGESGGIVLRLVEVEGVATEARIELASHLAPPGTVVRCVDALERPATAGTGEGRLEGSRLSVCLPAHGIVTLWVVSD